MRSPGFASTVCCLGDHGFAARFEAVALPRRHERYMIRGYAVDAGFAPIFVGPKARREGTARR